MTYELRSGGPGEADYTPYGENRDFMLYHGPEAILSGPAETGKTLAALWKLHIVACKYPGAQLAVVRKTQQSLYGTALQTFERLVLGDDSPVEIYGGAKPEWYDYPNGSRIYVGGLDKPEKVLSSERDIIYVNQAEELMPADWETITTRTTGRAGNMPYNQCIGDCNPAYPSHWIIQRSNAGHLKLFTTTHKDNPTLWDGSAWTEQGERSLKQLGALSGTRRARLFLGQWVQAEGVVYDEFQRSTHVMRREGNWSDILIGGDEGYTNPGVFLVIGIDGDGRGHVLEEFHRRQVLQADMVAAAVELDRRWGQFGIMPGVDARRTINFFIDPSAAGLIAEMRAAGLSAYPANNAVTDGIQFVKAMLAVAGDGRPRLTIDPDCVNLIAEMESFCWKTGRDGLRDEPEKTNDHGPDALRYGLMGTRAVEVPEAGVYVYDDRVSISPF